MSVESGLMVVESGTLYRIDEICADGSSTGNKIELLFQHGVVPEVGRNGFQNEEVLRALIDRVQVLNTAYPCRENSITITKLQEALFWQRERTETRMKRGVEGQNIV